MANIRNKILLDSLDKYYNQAVADFILGINKSLYADITSKDIKITWWDRVVRKWRSWEFNIKIAWEALRGEHECYE